MGEEGRSDEGFLGDNPDDPDYDRLYLPRKESAMKKKRMSKRLGLHRETLAVLTAKQAEAVEGGGCSTCHASFSCPPPPTGNNELSCLC
jgi:hypothetical protein